MTPPAITAALTGWPVPDALLQTGSERKWRSVRGGDGTDNVAGVAEVDIVESGVDVTATVVCPPKVCDAGLSSSYPSQTEMTA
jgi:hypothetical protein